MTTMMRYFFVSLAIFMGSCAIFGCATHRANSESLASLPLYRQGQVIDFDLNVDAGLMALAYYVAWTGETWIDVIDYRNTKRVGHVPTKYVPHAPLLSPDGQKLAFMDSLGSIHCYNLPANEIATILEDNNFAFAFPDWNPTSTRLVYYRIPTKRTGKDDFHLYSVDVQTHRVEQLTDDGATQDYTPFCSPDGNYILFRRLDVSAPQPRSVACLLNTRAKEIREIPQEPGHLSVVNKHHWSPDGASVLSAEQHGKGAGTIRRLRTMDLTEEWSTDIEKLRDAAFFPDGNAVLAITDAEFLWLDSVGGQVTARQSLAETGPCRFGVLGPIVGFEGDGKTVHFLSRDGTVYSAAPDGSPAVFVKHDPRPWPPFEKEEYWIESRDGFRFPVKRYVPPNPKPVAIMHLVGGPGAPVDPKMDPLLLNLLQEGFEVVAPVYRGCSGYGPEFQTANVGEWGRADVWDVVAAAEDWKQRLGKGRAPILEGYSYGGFLTLLSLAQEEAPWAGGISLWALVNLERQPPHMLAQGLPEDPTERAQAMRERSPLEQAAGIDVPLLILHGAQDPVNTIEDVTALRDRIAQTGGNCELIVYENDGHGLLRNRQDMMRRLIGFTTRCQAKE